MSDKSKEDYRNSHAGAEKGRQYARNYQVMRWRRHLWSCEKKYLDHIFRTVAKSDSQHLDFACGTGRVLEFAQNYMRKSVGVDVSSSMLAVCRENCRGATLVLADLTQEDPFPEQEFDVITAFRFFPNAQDQLRTDAMVALTKKLKPNGVLIFNNHKHAGNIVYRLRRLLGRPKRQMSGRDVGALLEEANLKVIDRRGFGILPADENWILVPEFVHRMADRFALASGLDGVLGQDIIYVCRKNP